MIKFTGECAAVLKILAINQDCLCTYKLLTLLHFHREAYTGCYPNVQEFIQCATADEPPSEKDLFHTQITYFQRKMYEEQITLNCREICKEIAAATSRHIVHIRINYEGEFRLLRYSVVLIA